MGDNIKNRNLTGWQLQSVEFAVFFYRRSRGATQNGLPGRSFGRDALHQVAWIEGSGDAVECVPAGQERIKDTTTSTFPVEVPSQRMCQVQRTKKETGRTRSLVF